MRLVDTHAHLDEESFDADRSEVLQRATQHGVVAVITLGTLLATSQRGVELSHRHPELHAAVGVHPNYVTQASDTDWDAIVRLAADPRVVGIGETGLDLYWKTVPLELQRTWFRRHLDLSRETGKPICIHCRDAEGPVLEELRTASLGGALRGVMHSFAGSLETAQECVALGLHVSFSGILTYKKSAALREVARQLPADRLLVETDSPYLSPQPVRGKRNEPAHVRMTAETLAEVRGLDPEQLGELTTANACRLFGLALS
jgi:TatD DNase family protein